MLDGVAPRICYGADEQFWQSWREEVAAIARTIISYHQEKVGMYVANCPFHQAAFYQPAYSEMQVAVEDGSPGQAESVPAKRRRPK